MNMRQVPLTVETVANMLRAIEPKGRLGMILGCFVATSDELRIAEEEALRLVRVAFVQRAIALSAARESRLVDRSGQMVMPRGPVDLARPKLWECPLCGAQVLPGVKHKHTAEQWMQGKKVRVDDSAFCPPAIGEGDCAIGPPAGELEAARLEASTPEEPPTLDETVRGAQKRAGCDCGAFDDGDTVSAGPHLPGCASYRRQSGT